MDMIAAAKDTIDLAKSRGMDVLPALKEDPWSYEHLVGMIPKMEAGMSEGKCGRWLGWMQACVVCKGMGTLEEMKQINKKYSGIVVMALIKPFVNVGYKPFRRFADATVYIKERGFFIDQGGERDDWGKAWERVVVPDDTAPDDLIRVAHEVAKAIGLERAKELL